MKAYNKPEFYVAEFRMNDVVAVCDRLPTDDYEYKWTEVNCLKTNSDKIFTVGTTGCEHEVDPNANGSDYAWYNDTKESNTSDIPDGLYFGWVGPMGSGGGSSGSSKLFDRLLKIFQKMLSPGRGQVIHIGPANDYLTQLYSHS